MYSPLYADQLNMLTTAVNPPGVHTSTDATTLYYQRMLFQRAMSAFEFAAPDNWDIPYLMSVLAMMGQAVVIYEPEYGVIPQWGTLTGFGIYYQPITANVVSPLINRPDLTIGKDCELIRLTPDYRGIYDIIQTYAELLSLCNASAASSLINSRIAYVFGAESQAAANMIKATIDKISRGETAVVYDNTLTDKQRKLSDMGAGREWKPWEAFTRDVKASYISDMALADYDTILGMFDAEFGIPSLSGAAGKKMERVNTMEVSANLGAKTARVETFYQCLTSSIEKVNRLFARQLTRPVSVRLRYKEEVTPGVGETDTSRVPDV